MIRSKSDADDRSCQHHGLMTDDTIAPATQQDIAMLMEEFGKLWIWKGKMEENIRTWKQEIIEHFALSVEQTRYELRSANREEVEVLNDRRKDHVKRIGALEQSVGLASQIVVYAFSDAMS